MTIKTSTIEKFLSSMLTSVGICWLLHPKTSSETIFIGLGAAAMVELLYFLWDLND